MGEVEEDAARYFVVDRSTMRTWAVGMLQMLCGSLE